MMVPPWHTVHSRSKRKEKKEEIAHQFYILRAMCDALKILNIVCVFAKSMQASFTELHMQSGFSFQNIVPELQKPYC